VKASSVESSRRAHGLLAGWLAALPGDTPIAGLVLAKIRWRIEHDYGELNAGPGLDHFEGRSLTGWHRHLTLATPSPRPSAPCSAPTRKSLRRHDPLPGPARTADLLALILGACPLNQPLTLDRLAADRRMPTKDPISCQYY
jgi:hypothetical protein